MLKVESTTGVSLSQSLSLSNSTQVFGAPKKNEKMEEWRPQIPEISSTRLIHPIQQPQVNRATIRLQATLKHLSSSLQEDLNLSNCNSKRKQAVSGTNDKQKNFMILLFLFSFFNFIKFYSYIFKKY